MINPTKEKFENTTLRLEYYEQIRMYSNILETMNFVEVYFRILNEERFFELKI